MSDDETGDNIEHWLSGLDTGEHYRNSDAYMSPVFEQISYDLRRRSFLDKSTWSDRPDHVSIPQGRFEQVVHFARNTFIDALENGEVSRLRHLERSLPKRLGDLQEKVNSLTRRVDALLDVQERFIDLAEQYDSLDEVAEADAMPDELEPISPGYSATGILGDEADFPHYLEENSPLRIAAHARLLGGRLREERNPKHTALAVGRLRLRILEYVLHHFEITGNPPRKLSEQEVEDETEKDREEARSDRNDTKGAGGRPPKVANDREISERDPEINWRLKSPSFYKQKESGELQKRDGLPVVDWEGMKDSIDDELFLGAGPETVRAHARRSENIDVEEKRRQMKKKEADGEDE